MQGLRVVVVGSVLMSNHFRLQRFIIAAAVLAVCMVAGPAASHRHLNQDGTTTSWYPHECCNDGDCRPVATVTRTQHGFWLTTVDGRTVLIGLSEVRRPSQDTRWHICIGPPDAVTHLPVIMCIFAPVGS
jgi:hypothetical protein